MGLSEMRSFSRMSSSSSVGRSANARQGEVAGEGVVPSGVATVGEAVELLIGAMLWLLIDVGVVAVVVFREKAPSIHVRGKDAVTGATTFTVG